MNRLIRWRLFWYVTKEALPLVFLLFLILTTLVFVQQFSKYSNLILSLQSSSDIAQKFLLSLIPGIVVITLPLSLLLGTVVACSRLSSDNELTAAQSSGISQLALATPFLALGLIGTVITGYLSSFVAPASLRTLKALRSQIVLQEANTRIRPHTFITSFPNLLLYVQNVDPRTGEWLGVFLLQTDPANSLSRLLTAERGQFRVDSVRSLTLEAQLHNGISIEYGGQSNTQSAPPSSQFTGVFRRSTVRLAESEGSLGEHGGGTLAEMTFSELTSLSRSAKTEREKRQAIAEKHKRFAFPFACLTLTALTFILAIQGKRFSTRPRTVVAILFLAMGFYLVLVLGQNLGLSGKIPVWAGVWFSNFLYGSAVLKSFISHKPPFYSLISFLLSPSLLIGSNFDSTIKKQTYKESLLTQSKVFKSGAVRPLNLINYLLISEIAKYFVLAIASLVATSIIFTLFDLIPAIIRNGTSLPYAASYLGYLAPQLAYYVAPFSLLVALLTGFSVLSRSNQLVIIAGAGQSRSRVITAALATSITLAVALWALSNYLLPYTNREQDIRYNTIKGRQVEQTTISFGRKWVFGKNNTIYGYQRIEPDNSLINGSIYHLSHPQGLLESTAHFSKATQESPSTWRINDGWAEIVKPDSTVDRKTLQAQTNLITIAEGAGLFRRTTNESSKMSDWDLQSYISQLKSVGISTLDLQVDLKKRVAFPFSCITLAILAIPFVTAKQARRSGPMISISLSVGIGLVFWLLTTFFEAVGKQDNLPIGIAVWGPHILFGAIGLYLNFFRHRLQ
jgi:LPS export ABC transporter permease LptF/LPS export ABC transporter permease LptG